MDFLNNAFAQIVDVFRSMSPGARLTTALLLIVVVVSLGYLFTQEISGPGVDLMHGVAITGNQLNDMVAAFGKAKLNDFKTDGTRILVPRGKEAAYMAAVAEAGALPPDISTVMDEELKKGSLFDNEKDKEQRRKNAKEKKLSLILSFMPGIEWATVLYDSDTKPGFNREKILKASVAVMPKGSVELDAERVSKIRGLVAGSLAGLKSENVTVFDANGRTWSGNSESGGNVLDDEYIAKKRTYEQDLKDKILNALSYIPNVTVEAAVTLDTKKRVHMRELKHDPKSVAVRELEQTTSRTQDSTGPAGRPGFNAQQPNAPQTLAASSGGSKEEEEQSKRETVNVPSGSETETEMAGLTQKSARVSIGVPISYFKSVWLQQNPVKEGEEQKAPDQAALDKIRTEVSSTIQKHVAQLLLPAEGVADPTELVTVTTFQDIPGKDIPAPSQMQVFLAWLDNYWSMLGMIGVAMVGLLMLRSLVRSVPAAPETRAMPRIANVETSEESMPEPASPAAPRLKRFSSGPSLRDELSDMVKQDPETAANILRGWITSTN